MLLGLCLTEPNDFANGTGDDGNRNVDATIIAIFQFKLSGSAEAPYVKYLYDTGVSIPQSISQLYNFYQNKELHKAESFR